MRHGLRSVLPLLLATVLILGLSGSRPAGAVADLAEVFGAVADSHGKPIADALVTLSGRGASPKTIRTLADGTYRFWAVQPSKEYRIEARGPGLRAVEYQGMRIDLGQKRHVNFRLRPPEEREAVVFVSTDPFPHTDLVRGFVDGLGVPARVINLDAEADPAEVVRHIGAEKPNVILAAGLLAGRLVRSEVHDSPSILTLISDPRRHDLKAPNICFITNNPAPVDVIDRLMTLMPKVRRVGLVFDAEFSELLARDLREAARQKGLVVETRPCYHLKDLGHLLEDLTDRIDALIVPYDPLAVVPGVREAISTWSLKHRVALLAPQADWVGRGALLSYGEPLQEIGVQAQGLARQILFESRQPGDFELQLPATPTLSVNRETADALGATVPDGVDPPGAKNSAPAPR
jgi:ABC-type uncharacterized transport system substrate-binding protein